jgi:polysaccharide biosynthesis protein PslG
MRRTHLLHGLAIGLAGLIVIALLSACGSAPTGTALPTSGLPTAQVLVQHEGDAPILIGQPTAEAAASGPTPAPAAAPGTPIPAVRDGPGSLPYPLTLTKLNFGVVGHLYYTDRAAALTNARAAGFTWFRQQIHWRDIEDQSGQYFWDELDNIVADVNAAGMLLMINITRSPTWYTANGSDGLPQDPAALARFAGALAERYSGRVQAILIWNEQNLAYENGGQIRPEDPGHFVEIMAAAYTAIKAADPHMIVVAGAPASTATNDPGIAMDTLSYLKAMYEYKGGMIRDYFDMQALHPGGSANPPETLWPDNPSQAQGWTEDPSFYFRHVENQRRVMEQAGMGDHQVWVTEYGWATPNDTPGYEFGNQISYEAQRDYIVGAINYTYEHYPWVSNMFLWNLNFTVLQAESGKDPNNEQGSFSILNADWSPRPAFYGVQQAIADIRSKQP